MPLFSIILPVYNAEETLCRCLDSILDQTYRDFELIIVDDGSRDRSGDICDMFSKRDSRCRTYHTINEGVSSARNFGIAKANGEYITFCDADDYVNSFWLQAFFNHIDSGCDLLVQKFIPMFSDDNDIHQDYFPDNKICQISTSPEKGILMLQECKAVGYVWCKLFKRSIILDNNLTFDESMYLLEDEKFVYEYFACCRKVLFIDEAHYYYSVPNWTKKYQPINLCEYLLGLSTAINSICMNDRSNTLYREHIARLLYALLDGYTKASIKNQFLLKRTKKEIQYSFLTLNDISWAVKIALILPSSIGHQVLLLKRRNFNL